PVTLGRRARASAGWLPWHSASRWLCGLRTGMPKQRDYPYRLLGPRSTQVRRGQQGGTEEQTQDPQTFKGGCCLGAYQQALRYRAPDRRRTGQRTLSRAPGREPATSAAVQSLAGTKPQQGHERLADPQGHGIYVGPVGLPGGQLPAWRFADQQCP